ncbi:bifunctional diaminohydroxyphosphoribosylaminopyrimidine deaminase/5-amino-6-(5-phosphoribosylamino)uracil reductase RibD [Legionella fairfieldensis]|uniref:bifunctional diaminohydroxyphosphoribosylaminopyrimidine deaminase/5-amino-6-(5-phosphoribosylamino)uracil reductase RibD n=1 Tax=Legionella fairfieldensis TaxID=45064 RepID=UPI0004908FBE|nr:bifunctional diaminohydroxyphosphoribosylaminopyrimidine deaminase/5-amino-6-(5-phosphoribosylamino)uracil reductase RibD [Legionella fairfieldensis]
MHKYFMLAALEQAWLGRGNCAPNPGVGAVAVHENKIIARASHQGAGTAHAEQLILQQLPAGLRQVVLYVTLEPCNHWGRTPPCVEGIIHYGISQVVYGFPDPNPVVAANNTPEMLRSKGVDVLYYPMQELDKFYQSYRYWMSGKKPWITAKLAQSLDGKIAGARGQRHYLSNADCAEFTHYQRLYTDVILTTAKTVKLDDPLLNVRLQGKEQGKTLAILDSRLSLDKEAKVFTTAKHCHIYHDEHYAVTNPYPNCSYHAVPTKEGRLDLSVIIDHLGGLGYHDVWVEGGGELFSALHQQELVQRTYLYLVPTLLGQEGLSAFRKNVIFSKKPAVTWQIKADNVIACLDWQEE